MANVIDNTNPEATPEFVDKNEEMEAHAIENQAQPMDMGAAPSFTDPAVTDASSALFRTDRGQDDAPFVAEAERIQQAIPQQDISTPVDATTESFVDNEPFGDQAIDNGQTFIEEKAENETPFNHDAQVTADTPISEDVRADSATMDAIPMEATVQDLDDNIEREQPTTDSQGESADIPEESQTNLEIESGATEEVFTPQDASSFDNTPFDSGAPEMELQGPDQEDPFADVLVEETPNSDMREDPQTVTREDMSDQTEAGSNLDFHDSEIDPSFDSHDSGIDSIHEFDENTTVDTAAALENEPVANPVSTDMELSDSGSEEGTPTGQTDDSNNNMPENDQVEVSSAPVEIERQDSAEKAETAIESHSDAEALPQIEFAEMVPDEAGQTAIESRDGSEPQQRGDTDNENQYNPHDNTVASVIDHIQGISDQSIDSIYEDSAALARDGEPYTMQEFQEDISQTLEDCAKLIDSDDLTTSLPADGIERIEDDMEQWIEDNLNDVDRDYNDMELQNLNDLESDNDDNYNDLDRNENTVGINEPDDDDDYDPVDIDSFY